MTVIGYIPVITDEQDFGEAAPSASGAIAKYRLLIDEFIEVDLSFWKSQQGHRINELSDQLRDDDVLMVAELSRLGRNLLEALNVIHDLIERGVKITFIRQPELSTNSSQTNFCWRFTVTIMRSLLVAYDDLHCDELLI